MAKLKLTISVDTDTGDVNYEFNGFKTLYDLIGFIQVEVNPQKIIAAVRSRKDVRSGKNANNKRANRQGR